MVPAWPGAAPDRGTGPRDRYAAPLTLLPGEAEDVDLRGPGPQPLGVSAALASWPVGSGGRARLESGPCPT